MTIPTASSRRRARLAVAALVAAVLALSVALSSAEAATGREGGTGTTYVQCYAGTLITQSLVNPPARIGGTPVAVDIWIWDASHGWLDMGWRVSTAGYTPRFTLSAPAGLHYVYVQYAWWMGNHWDVAAEYATNSGCYT